MWRGLARAQNGRQDFLSAFREKRQMDAGSVIAAVVISFDGFSLAKIYFRFVLIDASTSALYKVLGVSVIVMSRE